MNISYPSCRDPKEELEQQEQLVKVEFLDQRDQWVLRGYEELS